MRKGRATQEGILAILQDKRCDVPKIISQLKSQGWESKAARFYVDKKLCLVQQSELQEGLSEAQFLDRVMPVSYCRIDDPIEWNDPKRKLPSSPALHHSDPGQLCNKNIFLIS